MLVEGALERQAQDAASLDSKTVQVFSAATIVVGLAGAGKVMGATRLDRWLVAAAVGAYLVAALAAFIELWVRKLRIRDRPSELYRNHWHESPSVLKHHLIKDIARGFPENERKVRRKRNSLRVVLASTAIEAALIGVALLESLAS